ncbi:DUF4097 family beta strand repeat-containing protein [Streptomyces albiaxialis]|uniref:DUF4097 family beta strand repeat-containing protein n=1 Tax=Streptomyces albiaxialis TaxID=329523 RepID=A0ABN2VT84_9ACTN
MPAEHSWQISEPQKIEFTEPVTELHVRAVNGTVNVVGTDDPATRLEIGAVEGPPLLVTREGGKLVVAYEDLPWKGFLKWLDRKGWRRTVEVSVSVPAQASLTVGVVGASAVVSGMRGRTDVRGVSGDSTLVGLTGPVHAETVSGAVEAQRLTGPLRFNSVSGDLTFIDGGSHVRADTVSGSVVLDVGPEAPRETDIKLTTVSGEVAIRLPEDADAAVEARTTSGGLSSAFPGLRTDGQWGVRQAHGTLGAGRGRLRAETVSGGLALLKRPKEEPPGPDVRPSGAEGDTPDAPAAPSPAPSAPKDL